jgi:trans-aconitate methyltransferase
MDLKERESIPKKILTRHPWESARLEVISDLIEHEIKPGKGVLILDIGCGDLFFIERLSERYPYIKVVGVDSGFTVEMISEYSRANSNKNIRLYKSVEDASKVIEDKVSLVLLLDVMEHVEDEVNFLSSIIDHTFITQDTCFVITVPAYQCLFSSHDIFLRHYRRYNKKSLGNCINKAGLEATKSGYFFFSLVPLRFFQMAKEKVFKPLEISTGVVNWRGKEAKSAFIKNLLLWDYFLSRYLFKIGISLPGLSCYTLCRLC